MNVEEDRWRRLYFTPAEMEWAMEESHRKLAVSQASPTHRAGRDPLGAQRKGLLGELTIAHEIGIAVDVIPGFRPADFADVNVKTTTLPPEHAPIWQTTCLIDGRVNWYVGVSLGLDYGIILGYIHYEELLERGRQKTAPWGDLVTEVSALSARPGVPPHLYELRDEIRPERAL